MLRVRSGDRIIDHNGKEILGDYIFVGKIYNSYFLTFPKYYEDNKELVLFDAYNLLYSNNNSTLEVIGNINLQKHLMKLYMLNKHPIEIIGNSYMKVDLNDITLVDLELYSYDEIKGKPQSKYENLMDINCKSIDFRKEYNQHQLFKKKG